MGKSMKATMVWSFLGLLATCSWSAEQGPLKIEPDDGKFRVLVEGQLFAELDYRTYDKPIVYPIYGPGQISMTRNYPMRQDVAGEANDHPHHKSMWFAHGDVNGVSFWNERGKIVNERVQDVDTDSRQPSVTLANKLLDGDGNLVCRETVKITFRVLPGARVIDWDETLHAGDEPLRMGDTKEGTMGLRVHPNLRMSNDERRGVTTANGTAINSEGVRGGEVWGKRAKWVDYSGQIEGRTVGIAFFDHPDNLRHPTYWHARTYGLFAANPFGLSSFVGSGSDGSHTVPAGKVLRLQYRFVFHEGNAEQAKVEQLYRAYASP
jgi:hypothetical protein